MNKHLLTAIILGLVGWRATTIFQANSNTEFPNKPIQIVVPYSAGGGTDTFARIVQKSLVQRDALGVPFVIMNQDGGSATIGSRYVKNSKPDGYRLLCHHEGIIATKLAGVVNYGPEAFSPIAQTGSIVLLMVVRADSPFQSLTDLLEAAQKDPNKIRMGANQGSPAYFICKQLLSEYEGADFNFISAGGAKRFTYLLGGKLEAGIFSLAEYMSFLNEDAPSSENILAIGNFGKTRHPTIPNVTTSIEQGLKTSAENAYYIWAPLGTPKRVATKLADAFKDALEDPGLLEEFKNLSLDPTFRSGVELDRHLQTRVAAFEKLAVQAKTELPNFPAWTIGIVVVLLGIVGIKSLSLDSKTSQNTESESNLLIAEEHPQFNFVATGCLAILLAYVAALQIRVPFVVATPVAIFLMGATIAKWNSNRISSIARVALVFSLSLEFIFTKLFTVALP